LRRGRTILAGARQTRDAVAQLALDDRTKQVVLGREMAVERPTGQADRPHQRIHAGSGKAALLGDGATAFDQLLAGFGLVTG
jgi:hypothetical protein